MSNWIDVVCGFYVAFALAFLDYEVNRYLLAFMFFASGLAALGRALSGEK